MPTRQELLDSLRALAEQMMESLRMMLTIVFAMTAAINPGQAATEMETSPINQLVQEVARQRETIEQLGQTITQQIHQQNQVPNPPTRNPTRSTMPPPSTRTTSPPASPEWNLEEELELEEIEFMPVNMHGILPPRMPSLPVPSSSAAGTSIQETTRSRHGGARASATGPLSENQALVPTGGALEAWGQKSVNWGTKHPGKTYREVYQRDPGYVRWVLARPNATGDLADFFTYCTTRKALEDSVRASAGPASAAP